MAKSTRPHLSIDPTALLLAVIIAGLTYPMFTRVGDGTTALIGAGACGVGLLLSVAAHELSHAVVGRALGRRPVEIRLTALGGYTAFAPSAVPEGWWRSALISAAGPAANIILFAVCRGVGDVADSGGLAVAALYLGWTNLALGVFNLLPGLPLDGGRILEVIVAGLARSPRAGRLAAGWTGVAIGVLVILASLVPVLLGSGTAFTLLWAVLIGATLISGGRGAVRSASARPAPPRRQAPPAPDPRDIDPREPAAPVARRAHDPRSFGRPARPDDASRRSGEDGAGDRHHE